MKRLCSLIVACGLLVAPSARADEACIAAYEQTQTLRKDGKLLAAKQRAEVCAQKDCPSLLAKDCSRWLGEIEASTPSVVLDVKSPRGADLVAVHVTLDGKPLVDRIDGKAIALDPGTRTFSFKAGDAPPVERLVVVREGEKNRKLAVTLATGRATARPIPFGVWAFGAASVVALGVATVFAVEGLSDKSTLDACKPRCAPDDVDAMSAKMTYADVALGAGVMAGLAAAYLFVTRPTVDAARAPKVGVAARPFAAPLPGGGAVGLTARF